MRFGEYLQELLDKRGLSALTYAQLIGYKRNGFVSNVLRGDRRPPPKRLSQWMRPLRLTDDEAARFRELAKSASAKSRQHDKPYVELLEFRVERAEDALLALSPLFDRLNQLPEIEVKVPESVRETVRAIRKDRKL